jgi:hypothetical protein
MFTLILFVWFPMCAIVGVAAARRYDRSGMGWFFLSMLISPLLGLGFLLAVGPKKYAAPRAELVVAPASGAPAAPAAPSPPRSSIGEYAGVSVCVAVFLLVLYAAAHGQPIVVQPPGGQLPTYVYPGQNGGPTVIQPPGGQLPTYVYPGQNGGPAVVQPPGGQLPTYIYPPRR